MAEPWVRVASAGGFGAPDLAAALNPGSPRENWAELVLNIGEPTAGALGDGPVVYLFGDPIGAVMRRFAGAEAPGDRLRFSAIDGLNLASFRDEVDKGLRGRFFFQSHIRRWMRAAEEGADIVFARAETVAAHADALNTAVGRTGPTGEFTAPPSEWRREEGENRRALADYFAPAYLMLGGLPDLFRMKDGAPTSLIEGPRRLALDRSGMLAVVNDILSAHDAVECGEIEAFSIDDSLFRYGGIGSFLDHPEPEQPTVGGFRVTPEIAGRLRPRWPIPEEMAEGCPFYDRNRMPTNSVLLPPPDRARFGRIIRERMRLAPDLDAEVRSQIEESGIREAYAAHIRGPGRIDGGVGWMLWRMGADGVPYDLYFDHIDRMLSAERRPIFVFSDAAEVVGVMRARYGDLIRERAGAIRVPGGEGHIRALGDEIRQMGEDVVIETWMMAASRRFVHGNSNIATFVRCLNPELDAIDVYQPQYDAIAASEDENRRHQP